MELRRCSARQGIRFFSPTPAVILLSTRREFGCCNKRQVDGLILLPAVGDTIPIVVIDRSLPADINARYVLSDHYAGVGEPPNIY